MANPPSPRGPGHPAAWTRHSRSFSARPGLRAGELAPADIVEWDVITWSKAVSFWRRQMRGDLRGARVLEVGARDGGLTPWLLSEGARQVVCTDLRGPSDLARERHAEFLADGRVKHAAVDATDMPYISEFDVVVFKSVLGGIGAAVGMEGQQAAIAGMHRALRPGGALLFAENLVSSPLHTWLRRRAVAWGQRWRYVTEAELMAALCDFETVDVSSAGFLATLGRSEGQRAALAHMDSWLTDWAVPRVWNYLMFGVARRGA